MMKMNFSYNLSVLLLVFSYFCVLIDGISLMNNIYATKLSTISLLSIVLSTGVLITGCSVGAKKTPQPISSPPLIAKKLQSPSLSYLPEVIAVDDESQITAAQWMLIAQSNYQAQKYARSLRAATKALEFDAQSLEARQLAMLSAVKITETNIDSYQDDVTLSSSNKSELKTTLENLTTLLNTSDE